MLPIYGSFVFSCNKLISNTIPRAVCSRRVFVVTHDLQPCAALGHSRRLVPGVGPVEDDSDLIGQQRLVAAALVERHLRGLVAQRPHDLRHGRALRGEVDAQSAEPTYGSAKHSELVSFCNSRTRCSPARYRDRHGRLAAVLLLAACQGDAPRVVVVLCPFIFATSLTRSGAY